MYGSNYKWGEFSMGRYVKRDNVFKTNRFKFDCDTCEAWSYDWWLFVIRVGDTIYFNNARYSQQTDTHQDMAQNILNAAEAKRHGYKIVTVRHREGLNHLDKAISRMIGEIDVLNHLIAKPNSREKTNIGRRTQIERLYIEIQEAKKLKVVIDRQIKLNQKIKFAKDDAEYERKSKSRALVRMRTDRKRAEQDDQDRQNLIDDEQNNSEAETIQDQPQGYFGRNFTLLVGGAQ